MSQEFKLELLLKKSLTEFVNEIKKEKWFGKEREIINRFVFTKLLDIIGEIPLFSHPSQIGIEVRVKQVKGFTKEYVCKDLVIWKERNQTVWSKKCSVPLFIVEWKHNHKESSKYDIQWLKKYTKENPYCIGLSININTDPHYTLSIVTVKNGAVKN